MILGNIAVIIDSNKLLQEKLHDTENFQYFGMLQ